MNKQSPFDLYRRTGRTTRMLEEVRQALVDGNDVILYIKQSISDWLNKEFKIKQYNKERWINFENVSGKLTIYNCFTDNFNPMTGTVKGCSYKVFVDHHMLEQYYGWVIETWLRQNNQI